jgi:hypothetical protein
VVGADERVRGNAMVSSEVSGRAERSSGASSGDGCSWAKALVRSAAECRLPGLALGRLAITRRAPARDPKRSSWRLGGRDRFPRNPITRAADAGLSLWAEGQPTP